jgi:hypothetical protein
MLIVNEPKGGQRRQRPTYASISSFASRTQQGEKRNNACKVIFQYSQKLSKVNMSDL